MPYGKISYHLDFLGCSQNTWLDQMNLIDGDIAFVTLSDQDVALKGYKLHLAARRHTTDDRAYS